MMNCGKALVQRLSGFRGIRLGLIGASRVYHSDVVARSYCLTGTSGACNRRYSSTKTPIGRMKPTLSIVFTCNVCRTRQAKTMSKKSYQEGVVLIRCDGCENLHLIADNLGWFDDKKTNIVDILQKKQQDVTTLTDLDMLEMPDFDLVSKASQSEDKT